VAQFLLRHGVDIPVVLLPNNLLPADWLSKPTAW